MDLSETEIKSKVLKGLFWKILENGGAQGIQFVIAIILARLLSPAEYGLVSIIMIFITIANVVVQNVATVAKTMPEFTAMWEDMLAQWQAGASIVTADQEVF